MESTLPILLKNPRILLVGGGQVALRKAMVLQQNQIDFTLLTCSIAEAFGSLVPYPAVLTKNLEATDLEPFNIIIDATGNPRVKALLCQERAHRFMLLNIVDDPAASDFYFASLLNYGRLKIAVSTDGASPALGQAVRDRISRLIPGELAELVEEKAQQRTRGVIAARATRKEALLCMARVDLVGCGPGDVHLLTLQARQCLAEAEVVLYDHLISAEILDLLADRVEKIYVGKQKQQHSLTQAEINDLILQQARRGLRVARLKSGDPYVFGRGAEEAEFLAGHGVRVRVIPGLSSVIAAPGAAGIPLTARGFAASASLVSAHLAGSRLNTDWLPLLRIENHTTVVLMGLSFAQEIADLAREAGVPAEMPVAIVSNATLPNQQTIVTSIAGLPEQARRARRPAILVFGQVVRLHGVLPHGGRDNASPIHPVL